MQPIKAFLVGLSLVALGLGAPAHPDHSAFTFWEDTQTGMYRCESKDVIRCEIIAGGTCYQLDSCETYCFNHDRDAACVDMGENVVKMSSDIDTITGIKNTAEVPAAKALVEKRDASPQEDKHYVCSKDHSGVLICKYGFCSTYHYCNTGEECNDQSVSCESKSSSAPGTKFEVRAMPSPIDNAPISIIVRNRGPKENKSYVCSKDRASVLKCTYGFCATDYYCAKHHPCVNNPARCQKAFMASA